LRRIPEILSLGLFLLGLELATGTLSLTVTRLRAALLNPTGSAASGEVEWRSVVGVGLIVLAVALAGLMVVVRYRQRGIGDQVTCPRCGVRTNRVRRTAGDRVFGLLMGRRLSARRCGDCGWAGLIYKH
jgi:hypothetical protein